jgi:hypothetical protein
MATVCLAHDLRYERQVAIKVLRELPLTLFPGVNYRFRLINISVYHPGAQFMLVGVRRRVQWLPLAKDGADLPPWQTAPTEAWRPINIGETYDFRVEVADTGAMALEVRNPAGKLMVRQPIHFVK